MPLKKHCLTMHGHVIGFKMFTGLFNFLDFPKILQNVNFHSQHFVASMEGISFTLASEAFFD